MKKHLLTILIVFCFSQMVFPQDDDGVVALDLPIRNSLVFNRYAINPTFTFVREQNKYISITNKREWVQFENAPETFLATYSGRFAENIGAGVALFQQNYGVLTTFGGVLNFAYNVKLNTDKNLTFGLNVGAYKSGINTSNVITNFDDPSLQNVPSNFLLTINPGINYGTEFLDFGISVNNLVLYNFESSLLVEDNPKQGIQAHVMHSGYLNGRGFFSDTKLSAILKSEFRTDETIISGLAMLNVPKGLWLQVGYNNLYGVSGGVGLNITPQFALEYNIEKSIGELVEFGSSHEISLAYRFIPKKDYKYNGDDKVNGLFSNKKKRKRKPETAESKAELEGIRARAAERRVQAKLDLEAEKIAKKEAELQAKLDAEEKAKKEVETEAKILAAQKIIDATEARVKKETDAKLQERAAARSKILADQKAKEEAEAQAKLLVEQKAKAAADAQAKLLADQKTKEEAETQAKLLADQKVKEEAETQAKLLADQKAKEEAEAQAKLLVEQKTKAAADAQAKILADQKAKEEAETQAKLLADQKVKEEAEAQAKLIEEQKAKNAADAKAKSILLIEQNAVAEAAVLAKLIANEKAKTEAEAQAKLIEEQKAKEDADAQAQLLAKEKAIAEADAEAKLLAAEKAKADLVLNPKDELGKSMQELAKSTDDSKAIQNELLEKFDNIIGIKGKDLKDLKEENDLSDQGIAVAPRPFKSITAENNALNAIKSDLDDIIKTRSEKIEELKTLYDQRTRIKNTELDEVNLFYKDKIKRLSEEQLKAVQTRAQLDSKLETIRVSTEYEKRRRIKRAAFDNEEDKYSQDRATLQNIRQTTALSKVPLKVEDFDFGEEQGNNIQILKNIKNVGSGYYVVIAVHSNIKKRDDFVTKVVASGRTDVDFFYDLNTSKYYIYYDKSDSIENANEAMKSKGDRPYNEKMSIVKIEN